MNSSKENSKAANATVDKEGHKLKVLKYAKHRKTEGFSDGQAINDKVVGECSGNSLRSARINLYNNGKLLLIGNRINKHGNKEGVYALPEYSPKGAQLSPKYWYKKAGRDTLAEHLKSDEWAERKKSYYDKYPKVCFITGKDSTETIIALHHTTYENLYHEKDDELIPLSREMHTEVERLVKHGISRQDAHILAKSLVVFGMNLR